MAIRINLEKYGHKKKGYLSFSWTSLLFDFLNGFLFFFYLIYFYILLLLKKLILFYFFILLSYYLILK